MRRRGAVLLLPAFVIGLMISQAVAYWCRARVTGAHLGSRDLAAWELRLPSFLRDVWPEPDEGSYEAGLSLGHSSTMVRCPLSAPPDFRNDPPKYGLYTDTYGWPARSLVVYRACVLMRNGNGGSIDMRRFFAEFAARAGARAGVEGPAWMPWKSLRGAGVPVWPLWGGLVVNAVVYGVPAWVALCVPGALRRRRRERRGLCVACGYEVEGMDQCPECGKKRQIQDSRFKI